ncbi:hypothetical protein [Oscillibacter sp.]|uniref:hypothetical protein n=1 Tax=Oscillibacter sp. TaxID=1945593 RepID=UPI0028A9B964|nr:hypothetical protein [Oscillibacter sp.]
MEAIQSTATQVLLQLALGIITLLGTYGMYYLTKATAKAKAQIVQIKDDSTRTLLTNALEDVNELVGVTVGAIEQTTAAALREAVKSGKADRAALVALGKQAFEAVKAAVTPEAQKAITENLGSFDEYLQNLIESAVLKVKQETSYITLPESTLSMADAADTLACAVHERTIAPEVQTAAESVPAADEAPEIEESSSIGVEVTPSEQ